MPIWTAGPPFVERQTENLVSLFELSLQVRVTCVAEVMVAFRLLGAAIEDGGGEMVMFAVFDGFEFASAVGKFGSGLPTELLAITL